MELHMKTNEIYVTMRSVHPDLLVIYSWLYYFLIGIISHHPLKFKWSLQSGSKNQYKWVEITPPIGLSWVFHNLSETHIFIFGQSEGPGLPITLCPDDRLETFLQPFSWRPIKATEMLSKRLEVGVTLLGR